MVAHILRNQVRRNNLAALISAALTALVVPFAITGAFADPPVIAPAYQGKLVIESAGDLGGANGATQMVFGADGRLYVMTNGSGAYSFKYNAATGQLTNRVKAVNNISGIGIAFHTNNKGKTAMYLTADDGNNTWAIVKLTDDNGNGVWGEAGETRVKIMTGIPTGDHAVDQLLVKGDTLYVGIGPRTINGRTGEFTSGSLNDYGGVGFWSGGNGKTFGDSPLGGTICYIEDLNSVSDVQDSANPYGTNPVHNQAFYQQNATPYTIEQTMNPQTLKGKLRIHSAGTRNPFGMAFDKDGELWFTVNFNRAKTEGDGSAPFGYLRDTFGPKFDADIYDQLFHASKGADYGYSQDNWRGKVPPLNPAAPGYHRVLSTTYDQLFNKGPYSVYDPATPHGLGPSASADGCSFFYATNLPAELRGNLFIARYTGSGPGITSGDGSQTLHYQDVVAVDTTNGAVRRVAQGFDQPVCVLSDNAQRLLVGDFSAGNFWAIRPAVRQLLADVTLSRPNTIRAAVTLVNSGDITLTGISITSATLNGVSTATRLPILVGKLDPGVSAAVPFVFPASAATPNQKSVLILNLKYDGGSLAIRKNVTAP